MGSQSDLTRAGELHEWVFRGHSRTLAQAAASVLPVSSSARMVPRSRAAALAVVSLVSGCSAGPDYHDIEKTRACLDGRGLLVRHLAKERPQLLAVYHPRTEQFIAQIEFYATNHAAAKAAAEPPQPGRVTVPGDRIGNVVLQAVDDDREIRACL
jgi:hypothetical protein